MKQPLIGLSVLLLVVGLAQAVSPESAAGPDSAPGSALNYFKEGLALVEKGDMRAALSCFERARDLAPRWGLTYLEIAATHRALGDDRELIGAALEKAVYYGQDLPRAHYLYGVFLQESGRRQEAIKELQRAVELRGTMTEARFQLANVLVEEGRQSEGIEQCLQAVKEVPNYLGCRRYLAVLYEQSGQLEKAEGQLKAAAENNPHNVVQLDALARFYQRVGWNEKAQATLQLIEQVDPGKNKRKLRSLLKSVN